MIVFCNCVPVLSNNSFLDKLRGEVEQEVSVERARSSSRANEANDHARLFGANSRAGAKHRIIATFEQRRDTKYHSLGATGMWKGKKLYIQFKLIIKVHPITVSISLFFSDIISQCNPTHVQGEPR